LPQSGASLQNLVRRAFLAVIPISTFFTPAWAEPDACDAAPAPAITEHAGDFDTRQGFQRARSLARDGNYDAAILEYRRLSARHPDDVDYLLGEAQVRFWTGDNECALNLTSRARRLAPDYEDVWRLEYRVLQAINAPGGESREGATRLESFKGEANARFPGATWLRTTTASDGAGLRWETGINRESLDNGARDWQDVYAYVDRRSANDNLMSLTLTEHRRFSLVDNEIVFGGAFRFGRSWLFDGALRLSPDADFLAEVVIDAGAGKQLGNGWLAGVDVRHRQYPNDTVNTWGIEVERYFGSFRAAYHIGNTRLSTSSSFVHRAVLNYYAESGSRYGLTVAAGDEVEIIAPGQLLEMDISAVALSGRHPLGERLSVLWRVGTHRQGSIYRRNSVGLSIGGDF
jgi:YaiO family outer membrane protein